MNTLTHNSMVIAYHQDQDFFGISALYPAGYSWNGEAPAVPPFHLSVAGENADLHSGHMSGGTHLPWAMKCIRAQVSTSGLILTYRHEQLELEITCFLTLVPGTNAISQYNVLKNTGTTTRTITHVSSGTLVDPAAGGQLPWHDRNKLKLHTCVSRWQGEGQWRTSTLEDLGLYPTSIHPTLGSIHFQSLSSWSTSEYYPLVMLENTETQAFWFGEIEARGRWHLDIGHRKNQDSFEGGWLYMNLDCADEMNCGWFLDLEPGQEYSTATAVYGCVAGGFADAVAQLHRYKRQHIPRLSHPPLVFNDYMNCLWAKPSDERLLPLIEAAGKAGAEVFCIDAGWYKSDPPTLCLGDWEPDDSLFGPGGLKSITSTIREKGMIPGIWLEMETVHKDSWVYQENDSWFAQLHGKRVHKDRTLFDFRNPQVREHMAGKIAYLVEELGIGFFKNDYNQSLGHGDTRENRSPAYGIQQQAAAFYGFIDEIRTRYPHVIWENCASGGLREDFGAMRHFHLQSTSDQEHFFRYPSIIIGTTAFLLPEQAGVWAYPYPLLFEHKDLPEQEKRARVGEHDDSEAIIYTMINGMCGNLYLSGRIDLASPVGFGLIHQAIEVYKNYRSWLFRSYPVYPLGIPTMGSRGIAALGFTDESKSKLILALWRLDQGSEPAQICLAHTLAEALTDISTESVIESVTDSSTHWSARVLYPQTVKTDFSWDPATRTLQVQLPRGYSARLFQFDTQGAS